MEDEYQENVELIRKELVLKHRGIVEAVAAKYSRFGVEKKDILQEAWLGAVQAVNSWNPKNKAKLTTYIWAYAEGRVKQLLAKETKHHKGQIRFSELNGKATAKSHWRQNHRRKRRNPQRNKKRLKV